MQNNSGNLVKKRIDFLKPLFLGVFFSSFFIFISGFLNGAVVLAANSDIVLSEVLANAAEEDSGEFVELYNKGGEPVDVSGWFLKDLTDVNDTIKDFIGAYDVGTASTIIPAGGVALIVDPDYAGQYNDYITSGASLSVFLMLTVEGDKTLGNGFANAQDTVILDDNNIYVASFSWNIDAGEGVSFQKIDVNGGDGSSNWISSQQNKTTPGILFNSVPESAPEENQNSDNQQPTVNPSPPSSGATYNNIPKAAAGPDVYVNVGATVRFDASGSTDKDGNNLSFVWNFGDGSTAKGAIASHIYNFQGTYFVSLSANDGMAQGSDQMTVYVYPAGVVISEFLPNPEGEDGEKEWIELHNTSDNLVDIGGWHISDKSGKNFTLPIPTFIAKKGFLVLAGAHTKITLNNSSEEILLLYPNGEVADKVAFEEAAKEGYSAALFGDDFLWTKAPTPGFDNVKILSEQEKEKVSRLMQKDSDAVMTIKNDEHSKLLSGKKDVSGNLSKSTSFLIKSAEAKTVSGYISELPDALGNEAQKKAGDGNKLAADISAGGQSVKILLLWLFGLVALFGLGFMIKKFAKSGH